MPRYKITIEYDGTDFHGWQSQKNVNTIQNELENALFKLTHKKIRIYGASRTDAGVHAYRQIAHFNLDKIYETYKIQEAINHYLKPEKICIVKIKRVNDNFHARFSSKRKQYIYKIVNRTPPPTLLKNKAWHVKYLLNISTMKEASNYLIGTHDFSSFRAAGCQALSSIKTINEISINQINEEINIIFMAKSFLYNQIRIMVGTLYNFGRNKFPPLYMKKIIKSKNRILTGKIAPSHGLYLNRIFYIA